jgi:hypothetical protein
MECQLSITQVLRDNLQSLEFLSLVQPGQKPCMNDFSLVSATSISGAIKRSIAGESKKNTMAHITRIIDQTINFMNTSHYFVYQQILLQTLTRARVGINNLSVTYEAFPDIIAQIRVCLANIDIQLRKFQHDISGQESVEVSDEEEVHSERK